MIKRAEFDILVRKLELKTKQSSHLHAWFEFEGRVITRTRRSEKRGDLPMQHSIRQQLKLSDDELAGVIGCTMGKAEYVTLLRSKNLI